MRIRLLGTGAADGIPNAFCRCSTCQDARTQRRVRARSSLLIDDRILIDPGPDTSAQTARAGVDLRNVRHWLITHGHPDHLDPMLLLSRHWVLPDDPLHIWGPRQALSKLRDWLAPGSRVEMVEAVPGFAFELTFDDARYRIQAHQADHGDRSGHPDCLADEAVLWSVVDSQSSVLYATDTGPDPQVCGGPYSVVLLDATFGPKTDHRTGHLDFLTTEGLLARWREAGVIDDRSRVIATHIGHHNPPFAELVAELSTRGLEVFEDGTHIDLDSRAGFRMLVTGGIRSGKSRLAERVAATSAHVHYVATARDRDDAEWHERVSAHRKRRPAHWTLHETTDPVPVLAAAHWGDCVLIDCLSLWLTHILDDADAWTRLSDPEERARLLAQVDIATDRFVTAIADCEANVVCVTNEVGMSLVPVDDGARLFSDLLGRLATRMSAVMTDVVLVVAGHPVRVLGDHPIPEAS